MKIINTVEFEETIKSGLTLVDFYADWCGPCKMLGPVLEEVDGEYPEIYFVKVNVDENMDLAQKFNIMSIPCLVAMENGKEVKRSVGLVPKVELERFIGE